MAQTQSGTRRWAVATSWLAAALAWAAAPTAYHLGMALHHQAGWLRSLGTAAVGSLLIGGLAAALAGAAVLARLDRQPPLVRFLGVAFTALAWLAIAWLGLAVFYRGWEGAPVVARWGAGAFAAVGVAIHLSHPPEWRSLTRTALRAMALVGLAVPLATAPLVAWGAATDQPRVPAAVPPMTGAVRSDAPKRIILITLDSLGRQACHLTAGAGDTPNLAKLAREAVHFERCIAASDRTLCVMPAVLTGIRPTDIFPHQSNVWGYVRPAFATGLAGHLRQAGYRATFASSLVSPAMLGMAHEYDHGFSSAPAFPPNELNTVGYLPLRETAAWLGARVLGIQPALGAPRAAGHPLEQNDQNFARALELAAAPGRNFVWVHGLAPHLPYYDIPRQDYGGPYHPDQYPTVSEHAFQTADAAQLHEIERTYRSYVRYADDLYGRFEAALRARGLWEDSLVVVLGDHGEAFTPGERAHSYGHLNEAVTHVPLLIKAPGSRAGKGSRRLDTAGSEDLVPTILGAVYVDATAGLPGIDLLHRVAPANRILVAWAPPPDKVSNIAHQIAAYQGDLKLLRTRGQPERLVDVVRDPTGLRDLRADRPAVAAALGAHLDLILKH